MGVVIASSVPASPRFKLFSLEELRLFPPLQWLIQGVISRGAFAVLAGPPGHGKSFLALAWALHVSADRSWEGRAVRAGSVVYVAGEGVAGLVKRVDAWRRHTNTEAPDRFRFMRDPPQLRSGGDWGVFLDRISAQNVAPELIVLDTFARSFVGGEENSAKDVGEFNEAVRCIIQRTGASVLVLHHTRKPQNGSEATERGSTSLRGAVDTLMQLKKQADFLTLTCTKQKDAEEFKPIELRMKVVALGADSSCVLESIDEASLSGEYEAALLNQSERTALDVLHGFSGHVATSAAWQTAIQSRTAKPVPDRTFQNWRGKLQDGGFVAAVDGQRGHYYVTERGSAIASGTSASAA